MRWRHQQGWQLRNVNISVRMYKWLSFNLQLQYTLSYSTIYTNSSILPKYCTSVLYNTACFMYDWRFSVSAKMLKSWVFWILHLCICKIFTKLRGPDVESAGMQIFFICFPLYWLASVSGHVILLCTCFSYSFFEMLPAMCFSFLHINLFPVSRFPCANYLPSYSYWRVSVSCHNLQLSLLF